MRRTRWLDWAVAGVLALTLAAVLIWPTRPGKDDLELTVEVAEIEPYEVFGQQTVAVTVRWRWLNGSAGKGTYDDYLMIGYDPARWVAIEPSSWYGTDWFRPVLGRMGELPPLRSVRVVPAEEGQFPPPLREVWVDPAATGEFKFLLIADGYGRDFETDQIPVQIHYLRRPAVDAWSPPGRAWVKTVSDTFPLR